MLTRPLCCSSRLRLSPRTMSNADILVVSGAELAVLAMDRGKWAEAAERVNVALATIDEHRMDDNALSVLAFAAAARLAVHRGDLKQANARLTQAMRARPSCNSAMPYLGVRSRLQLAKVYSVNGDHATARHLAARDRRHPAAPTGTRRTRRRRLGASPHRHIQLPKPARPGRCRSPRRSSGCFRISRHISRVREIAERLFVSRSTVNTQVSSIYRKLGVSSRSATPCNKRRRPASSADSGAQPPNEQSKTSSVSYPSANASLGAAATTQGNPTMGTITDQDVDDLRDRGAGAHRASACAP